jgi:hypothetical protein
MMLAYVCVEASTVASTFQYLFSKACWKTEGFATILGSEDLLVIPSDTQPLILPEPAGRWRSALWSYLKHGPGHLAMYTFGRFETVRKTAVLLNRYRNPPLFGAADQSRDIHPLPVNDVAAQIERDGLFSGLVLKQETLEQLQKYCAETICYGEGERSLPLYAQDREAAESQYGRRILLGRYLDCRSECPPVARLEHDATLRAIARQYFGSEPVLIGARMWWSFATHSTRDEQSKSGQTFHYDIDGYRSLAFFFYLTDVDEEGGPHIYVSGSHKRKQLRHLVSLKKSRRDAQVEGIYGRSAVKAVEGKAGHGFAEDIFCFHKGLGPRKRDRLVLQIRFGLHDYGTSAAG